MEKCIICRKNLKVYEHDLCGCKMPVCMKHRDRSSHNCQEHDKVIVGIKIVAKKINKI